MSHGSPINYSDIWKEVNGSDFQNIQPPTECDKNSIKEFARLYRDAQDIIKRNPPNINATQMQDLRIKTKKLKTELERQIPCIKKALKNITKHINKVASEGYYISTLKFQSKFIISHQLRYRIHLQLIPF